MKHLLMVRNLCCFALLLACATVVSAEEVVLSDFEGDSYGQWTASGDAFGRQPADGALDSQMPVEGFQGEGLVNSYLGGDAATGTLTSPEFTLSRDHLSFLIGGGELPDQVGIELLVGGKRKRVATGSDSETLGWHSWDVRDLRGEAARLRIFDRATDGWGHVLVDQLVQTDTPRVRPLVGRLQYYRKSPAYYHELYRPQLHFTPEINWMNDPNGLVFFDGEYHLFYQHNPHGIEWGHMSWGHAVSGDLLHWTHLPIALHDEYGVMTFSGSAVVDAGNTSGFGTAGEPPLVAIYTGHGHNRQTQNLAYSIDRGRHWTKYAGNPVLDIGAEDFRDPKVFWHDESDKWVMVVALAAKKRLQFYGSPDLKQWNLLSEFGPAGVEDKPNWECPDLFELPIENEPGKTRWVLEVDMGSGAVAGGSGGEYFTGIFDGTRFISDSNESQWVDYGRDFYAAQSWNHLPREDGRRIWTAWMNNWQTAQNPTYPWCGAMAIPRVLSLRRINDRLQLCQRPVREIESLRRDQQVIRNLVLNSETKPLRLQDQHLDILVEFQLGSAKTFGLRVLKQGDEQTEIGYDAEAAQVYVDRTDSGSPPFHPAFPGRHVGPLPPTADGTVRMRIIVDASSVEVFGGDGQTVITDLVFPDADSNGVELFAEGGSCRISELAVYTLDPVWHPKNHLPLESQRGEAVID